MVRERAVRNSAGPATSSPCNRSTRSRSRRTARSRCSAPSESPNDGKEYPLPPGLGQLDLYPIDQRTFVAPMHRVEALWLNFEAPWWKPRALKVGVGSVDAVSGETFDPHTLGADPQDYVVIPAQPWLDGINCGEGLIRQFVAVPLGEGLTVEEQLTEEATGGMNLALFAPKPGRFPDRPPVQNARMIYDCDGPAESPAMGLGAGGLMRQGIYEDEHGIETWEPEPARTLHIELVDATAFEVLTGLTAPPPPVNAASYTHAGLPWFDLVDNRRRDLKAAERLTGIRSIGDLEDRAEGSLPIPAAQVRMLLNLRAAARPLAAR